MEDRQFFNTIAQTWDQNNDSSTPEKIDEVLTLAGIAPDMRILDIGTGTGILIPYLADIIGPDGHITAVDLAENMLAIAKEKYQDLSPKPEFHLLNVEQDKIDGRFDRIMLYCVYPHIHHPEATLTRLIRENLAPDGEIIIAHPTSRSFINDVHFRRPIHSEGLPSGQDVKLRLATVGIHTDILADDDRLYVLRLTPESI